jgi:hypothetical protein
MQHNTNNRHFEKHPNFLTYKIIANIKGYIVKVPPSHIESTIMNEAIIIILYKLLYTSSRRRPTLASS